MRSFRDKAARALLALELDPYKGHALTGSLCGARSLEFSLPGGAYRAAYVVLEEERTCLVFLVGPHEGFYRKAERRMEALRRLGGDLKYRLEYAPLVKSGVMTEDAAWREWSHRIVHNVAKQFGWTYRRIGPDGTEN